jgi:hypothetical protein
MAYNPNIPQPTNLISNSQGDILGNFTAIDSGATGTGIGFSRNHVTMTDGTNGGLHYKVDYNQPIASPTPSSGGTEYTKTVTNIELFYKNSVADMQITNSALTTTSGQGMLPGGLQIRVGTAQATGDPGSPSSITPPFSIACLGVIATPKSTPSKRNMIIVTAVAPGSFTLKSLSSDSVDQGGAVDCYYIAIGY